MSKLKNIVFDFGGVLIDWNPVYLYANVFQSEEEMNFFLNHVCTSSWNMQQDAGRPLSVATGEKQMEFPEYKNEIAMYYGRWTEMLGGIFEENVKLIKPLKEKYHVYGLTNWSAETIPLAMQRYDFFGDLEGIVVSGEEKLVKPDPEIYRVLMNRYHILPQETLFIDDNAENIRTAKALKFKTLHLTEGVCLEKKLRELDVEI